MSEVSLGSTPALEPESEWASCSGRAWVTTSAPPAVDALAQAASLPHFVAHLLWARGMQTAAAADTYLQPSDDQLHDAFLLCGMAAAVDRIVAAVRHREPMLIYGDYDVDGTLATVLLKTAIDRITPKGTGTLVRYHVPHRIREGYGVQGSVLAEAAAQGVRLVISVDTGIRAFAAAEAAQSLGLDLIVTDHHLPEERGLPCAVAVINPNQSGCPYPEKQLCGAAVAWKLAEALLRAAQRGDGLQPVDRVSFNKLRRSLLKLVAIATVADAVPLTGENRAIVALGLAELCDVRQPGLRALMRLARAGGDGRAPLASEIAFRIAPRINAAGRMDVASDVVHLLLTRDHAEAEVLATKLHQLNEERRNVEAGVLAELHSQLDVLCAGTAADHPPMFVLDGQDWHRGVIGILASRVVDRTGRPALVITHQDDEAHGSGRSVPGFHLLDALTSAHTGQLRDDGEDLFLRFGGHAHAVGFSLASSRVPALRRRMLLLAAEQASQFTSTPPLRADAPLPLHRATTDAWHWLCRMQPFGNGNEDPVFLAEDLLLLEMRVLKQRHLKLRLQDDSGPVVECLCWARSFDWVERAGSCGILPGSRVDLLYQLRWNEQPNFGGLEVHACDLRLRATS